MELQGVTGAPYKHPEVRKAMPAPYQRPSVAVGGSVRRLWNDVSVTDVRPGDTVAGFGIVAEAHEDTSTAVDGAMTWAVRLHNVLGHARTFPGHERVYAFTPEKQR